MNTTPAPPLPPKARLRVAVVQLCSRDDLAHNLHSVATLVEHAAKQGAALVSASSPVAGVVEIHTMSMNNGVMTMRPIPRLELPAGKAVQLAPGGYHVMLMDLKQPLKTGEVVPITLKLEGKDKALTSVDVKAVVRPLNAAAPDPAMSHHKH